MEDIKDRLGNYKYNFFNNLQNYIETELIFFGSIKRFDFFKNSSDIDIIIITDDVKSLLYKVQNFLNIKKTNIKKIYQQYSVNDNIVYGYKIKYDDKDSDMSFDLLIYDDKFRTDVMKNINDINNLPISPPSVTIPHSVITPSGHIAVAWISEPASSALKDAVKPITACLAAT